MCTQCPGCWLRYGTTCQTFGKNIASKNGGALLRGLREANCFLFNEGGYDVDVGDNRDGEGTDGSDATTINMKRGVWG